MTNGAGNSWEEIKEVPVAVEEVTVEGGGHELVGIEILVAGDDDRVAADGHEVEGEPLHMSPTGLSQLDYRLCPSHCSFWFNNHTRAATHSDVPTSVTGSSHPIYVAVEKTSTKEDNPNSVQRNRKTKLFGIEDPNIVKTKGNPRGNSSIGKPKRQRKCGRCRVPGHTKRTCPKFPSASRGVGSNSFNKNDYQPSATHCPSEDSYPTPPPSPFTQTGCKRKSTGLAMTHRVTRQLYTNHERTDLTNGAIQSRHDISRATASRDAQVCQNGSFTISEASKKMKKELQQTEPSSQGSEGEAHVDKADDSEDGFLF
ncbi:hypothetical protein RHMOL_Rhmol06G0073000 [Rhododendron molle]|uniref:Uncharacterized protein n=1 Tax=Rhododendron molle TaxID=49168 RepID=A0ACC0NBE5_RHOML|nr:hypothetical protein RHMOL_Rhmol06G0073000 [Rhododendron molle]